MYTFHLCTHNRDEMCTLLSCMPIHDNNVHVIPVGKNKNKCFTSVGIHNNKYISDKVQLFLNNYLYACQARVTVGNLGLCCTCVTYFEH